MTKELIENYRRIVLPYMAKELLRIDYEGLGQDDAKEFTEHFNEILNLALKALEQETRWIPVSERLPKAGEYVGDVAKYYLVQNEFGDMMVARFTHSEYWEQIYQLKPISDKIVAWMPLPEPYRAEREGENE